MDEQINMEQQLWDYIDGLCDAGKKSIIEELIQKNTEWRLKYHELLEANLLMQSSELETPSLRFTKNVMEEIARYQVAPATRSYINNKIIWGIGGFFLLMILGFLIYGLSQLKLNNAIDPKILTDYNHTVGKLDWSRFFSSTYTNIFMMVNIVLGLMMLDIYLNRKKNINMKADKNGF